MENNRSLYLFGTIIAVGLILVQAKKSKLNTEITENEIMQHIRFLSHKDRGGRYPGTRESKDVISYIVKSLKSYGVKPGAGNSYIQPFNIKTGIELESSNYIVLNSDTLSVLEDYAPLFFSSNSKDSGQVVFAGYGFNINTQQTKWNDYAGIDVERKMGYDNAARPRKR